MQINPYAVAGDYHAVIAFVEGGTRVDAETRLDGAPQALVDLSVASDLTASLHIEALRRQKDFIPVFPSPSTIRSKTTGTFLRRHPDKSCSTIGLGMRSTRSMRIRTP